MRRETFPTLPLIIGVLLLAILLALGWNVMRPGLGSGAAVKNDLTASTPTPVVIMVGGGDCMPDECGRIIAKYTATAAQMATGNAIATAAGVAARETSAAHETETILNYRLAVSMTMLAPTAAQNELDIVKAQAAATLVPSQTAQALQVTAVEIARQQNEVAQTHIVLASLSDLLGKLVWLVFMLFVSASVIGLIFLWRYLAGQTHAHTVKAYLVRGPDGEIYDYNAALGLYVAIRGLVDALRPALTRPQPASAMPDAIPTIGGGQVVQGFLSPPRDGDRPLTHSQSAALRLLRDTLTLQNTALDWPRNVIPGHARLRWSGEAWTLAVNSLGPHVKKGGDADNSPYILTRFESVIELYEVLNREWQPT
jgi:hypothetical protein